MIMSSLYNWIASLVQRVQLYNSIPNPSPLSLTFPNIDLQSTLNVEFTSELEPEPDTNSLPTPGKFTSNASTHKEIVNSNSRTKRLHQSLTNPPVSRNEFHNQPLLPTDYCQPVLELAPEQEAHRPPYQRAQRSKMAISTLLNPSSSFSIPSLSPKIPPTTLVSTEESRNGDERPVMNLATMLPFERDVDTAGNLAIAKETKDLSTGDCNVLEIYSLNETGSESGYQCHEPLLCIRHEDSKTTTGSWSESEYRIVSPLSLWGQCTMFERIKHGSNEVAKTQLREKVLRAQLDYFGKIAG